MTKRILAHETETVVVVWTYKVGETYERYEQSMRMPPEVKARREGAEAPPLRARTSE